MATYRIQAPDGSTLRFDGPDGATDEQVMQYAMSQWKPRAEAAPTQQDAYTPAEYNPASGTSTLQFGPFDTGIQLSEGLTRGLEGAGKAFADTGRGLKQLYAYAADYVAPRDRNLSSLVTGNDPSRLAEIQRDIDEAKARDSALMSTGAGVAGNVAGNVAMMLTPGAALKGASMLPKASGLATVARALTAPETINGAAALGAGLSAIQPVATGESRAENAVFGALTGGVGQAAGKLLSRVIQPVQGVLRAKTEAAKILSKEGVPVAASQATGSKVLQLTDAAFDNIPTTAGKQQAFREAQQKAFNRAVLRRVGESADEATGEVLDNAYTRIGGVFESLTAGKEVKLGSSFLDDLAKVEQGQSKLFPSSQSAEVRKLVDDGINLASIGKVDGVTLQAERSKLSRLASSAWRSGNNDLAEAYSGIVDAIDNAVSRSLNATEKAALNLARRQYGNLKAIERAGVESGNISPAKLSNTLRTINKKAHITGKGDLVKLAKAGKEILPAKVGDPGTAQRLMYQNLLTGGAAGGIGGYAATGDPNTALMTAAAGLAAPSAIRSLLYSKPMQSYLTSGLLNNTPEALLSAGRGGATLLPVGLLNALQE